MQESATRNNDEPIVEEVAELEEAQGEDTLLELDLSDFHASESKSISRTCSEPGVITVVNSKDHGKRVSLSEKLLTELNHPKAIQVSLAKDRIALAEKLSDDHHSFTIKKDGKNGKRGIVYASGLVEEITKQYNLDFSSRVSVTFGDVQYLKKDGYPVAVVTMKNSLG